MRLITNTLFMIILLTVGTASMAMQREPVVAARDGAFDAPGATDLGVRQDKGMTLSEAVEQVRRQYDGRIVSAETIVSGGRETHVIKVLTDDGKVKTVRIPGRRI